MRWVRSSQEHPILLAACPWRFKLVFSDVVLRHPASIALRWGGQTIGRQHPGADVVVQHPAIGKRHAEIVCESDVVIRDISENGGVFVNQRPIDRAVLRRGDVVGLGGALLVLEHQERAASLEELASRAGSRSPVIIEGEMGTGKDFLANLIHRASGRTGRFVAENCARFRGSLGDSALFGHERGAFTGAAGSYKGLFACAHRGTLFLDEIAELTPDMQSTLLRVLQTRRFRSLGSNQEIEVDVRIIAASAMDLDVAVRQGKFRADLRGRLRGRYAYIPPLRDNRARILPVFLEVAEKMGTRFDLTQRAVERLLLESWEDNVRGLEMFVGRAVEDVRPDRRGVLMLDENLVERLFWRSAKKPPLSVVFSSRADDAGHREGVVHDETLRDVVPARKQRAARARHGVGPSIDRDTLLQLLEERSGNVSEVARVTKRRRQTIYRWMDRYGIPQGHGRSDRDTAPGKNTRCSSASVQ